MKNIENGAVKELLKLCGKYGLSVGDLALHLNVLPVRFYEIISGKRRVTIDTDLRLCKFFKLKNGFFFLKQVEYDMYFAQQNLEEKLGNIIPVDKALLKKK